MRAIFSKKGGGATIIIFFLQKRYSKEEGRKKVGVVVIPALGGLRQKSLSLGYTDTICLKTKKIYQNKNKTFK